MVLKRIRRSRPCTMHWMPPCESSRRSRFMHHAKPLKQKLASVKGGPPAQWSPKAATLKLGSKAIVVCSMLYIWNFVIS